LIPCQRHLFDIRDDVAYLNCAYMSPLMHSVVDAGRAGLERKLRPWTITPADFFNREEDFRAVSAKLFNFTADDVAIVPSTSYGLQTAAGNIQVARGQKILLLEDQFPSNVYPWWRVAEDCGAELVTVARPSDGDWTAHVLDTLEPDVKSLLAAAAVVGKVFWAGAIAHMGDSDLAQVTTTLRELSRKELVRRLQEYERFKRAAESIDALPRLERDVWSASAELTARRAARTLPQITLQEMLTAFKAVVARAEMFAHHHIQREQLSVGERMSDILAALAGGAFVPFVALFRAEEGRMGVTVTFVAILELMREGLIDIVQAQAYAPLHLRAATPTRALHLVEEPS